MEEKTYFIQLWRGAGYWLNDSVIVKSFSIDEALVIASIKEIEPTYKDIQEGEQ